MMYTPTNSYQLTRHPVGSVREIWAISWPLMLGLISGSLMIFTDRLFLSWYSPLALNAGVNSSMAYLIFLVVPMGICAISEVFAGRLHGEGSCKKIGGAVWQMIWFAIFLSPLFWAIAKWCPDLIFYQSSNIELESEYFSVLMSFAPFFCVSIALNGFFIGIGKVQVVTYCTIVATLVHVGLDYIFIFGWGPIPPLGVTGAGIATGLAQILQAGMLFYSFFGKENRHLFGTLNYRFGYHYFKEGIKIGAPAGLGHAVEVIAHFLFFRIIMTVGADHMTVVALVQSFYVLFAFILEAQSKGVSAIVANLLGAGEEKLIKNVLKAAFKLQTIFFALFALLLLLFPEMLLTLFLSSENAQLLKNPEFAKIFYHATIWMSIFYLFDGFSWILIGLLTAAGDTKFIFYVSSLANWFAYVLPAFLFVGVAQNGADVAWMIIAIYSVINFGLYFWRYKIGKWLTNYPEDESMATS